MKTAPPDALKSDLPESVWGKVLGATPVVLTVVATMLAGLSSSEMTSAQYERSLAAQQQSKAGDQWNFFQGKRLRSSLQHSTLDVVESASGVAPLNRDTLVATLAGTSAATFVATPQREEALRAFLANEQPKLPPAPPLDPGVRAAAEALETYKPEPEIKALLSIVNDATLEGALRNAQAQALAFDAVTGPVGQLIDQIEGGISRTSDVSLRRTFITARLTYNARRYDAESRLNKGVAGLYELQVHKSNYSAERHHRRSQRFFYGMLAAQMGVIISTLAIAAKKRSLLWSLAAAAGAVSIIFAAYVYLYV